VDEERGDMEDEKATQPQQKQEHSNSKKHTFTLSVLDKSAALAYVVRTVTN
jgi:hypothetical protein